MEYFDLNGEQVPKLGLGTWQIEGDEARESVRDALEIGYRHIDTAQAYQNEQQVGQGIAESPVDRDDIFLTTKVWKENARAEDVQSSTEESLRKLDTEYVDLLLLHWPVDDVPVAETLNALAELKQSGKARHIGVSNFTPTQLREACSVQNLATNQVEYHPYLDQSEVLAEVRERGMFLTAYSPLARGRVIQDEVLDGIGQNYGKSGAQVALRWQLQQDDVVTIPKAASSGHRKANFDIFDFELTEDEMQEVSKLARGDRLIDPGFAPDWE
jgi:2,5-diketo-D-gluconate reductase B